MTTLVDLKEFVSGFILEADEHLHSINENLVAVTKALKENFPEPRAVRDLYRSLHTIKGLASMVGAEPIVEISHEMESILRTADRAGGRLSEASLDLLLQGTRALEERVNHVAKQGVAKIPAAPKALLEALGLVQTASGDGLPPERVLDFALPPEILQRLNAADREQMVQAQRQGRRICLIEFQPSPEMAARGFNITSIRERLTAMGELIKVVPRSVTEAPTGIAFALLFVTGGALAELTEAVGGTPGAVHEILAEASGPVAASDEAPTEVEAEWMPSDHTSIRVDIRRLDEALERLSDLIVTRSKLEKVEADLRADGTDTRELKAVIGETNRKLKRLRAAITEARMVSLADLLQRLPLVVRGLTKDSGKLVNLEIRAGAAEVDKAVADKVFPAIVHLIRNAVDHAIETREERARAGKPETGSIVVVCDDSSGTSLTLTITDDGRGVDRAAVARKAQSPEARNDVELLDQLTTPGLSTRDDVTRTSGRGMGMDIVRRSVEMLSGSLSLRTEPGRGTTFALTVPVSVTIVDVLSFVAGGQTFVTPIAMIDEILEIGLETALSEAPASGRSAFLPRLLQRRGEAIPFLGLAGVLDPKAATVAARRALVVNQLRGTVAFGIDRLLGQQEVVVRALDDVLVKQPAITGATDLGDGRPTLVLDLAALGALVQRNGENAL